MKHCLALTKVAQAAAFTVLPTLAHAESAPRLPPAEAFDAQVIFLGENHDNPEHHATQAEWVAVLEPRALVFEMLTPEQADRIAPELRSNPDLLAEILEWEASGWPDFSMYYPIFAGAPQASIFGAGIPPERVRGLARDSLAVIEPELTARFSLDVPLPVEQQAERQALQKAAHCDLLPDDLLPMMVEVQRLRDAALADVALAAFQETGGPVIVILGNGHARDDWGAPFLLRQVAPDVAAFSLGQGEDGQPPHGGFGLVVDAAPVDRGDPCNVFR